MAVQNPQYPNFASGAVNLPNAAETVGITTRSVSTGAAGQTWALFFSCAIAVGAAATSISFQVRRTSPTGTSIYSTPTVAVVASTMALYSFAVTDAPAGDFAGLLWVATFVVTGGAVAGTLTNGFSSVYVAS